MAMNGYDFIVFEVCVKPGAYWLMRFFSSTDVLVAHHDVFERADLFDEQRDLRAIILEVHVLAHARTQLFSLST